MTGRFVVTPSRSRILWRSVGYGTATGAAVGSLTAATIGCVASVAALNPAGIALGLIVGAPVAAVIGSVVGAVCGLAGGLSLLMVRIHVAASRSAIRTVAACGAGALPAAWSVALAVASGQRFSVVAALSVVTVALAAALGPRAFFGKSRPSKQRPRQIS